MYKIYDKPEAIRQIQIYLGEISEPSLYIAPTGVYDDATTTAVLNFQEAKGFDTTGIVDRETFDALFADYVTSSQKQKIRNAVASFISFPVLPGRTSPGMMHINRTMANLLDNYGQNHSLRESNFYSEETAKAVEILRKIYLLAELEYIDELLYDRMIRDHSNLSGENIF